ncbi:uncharacterized protein LOC134210327 [Armigeres subalbatus]|uniref:uncharacterized protein LOC134210327 n=1 Tax=Armigeres subalbatus TaxID=124917 RepID=UPI002ED1D85C
MDATELDIDNSFWNTVEEILGEPIPLYLKKIVTAGGFARFNALKTISDEFKVELESFAREQLTMLEKSSENFHIFHRNPRDFRIVPGHWNLLRELPKKMPENKKMFLKHKMTEASRKVAAQRIQPSKMMRNAAGSSSTSTVGDESSMVIRKKIETWLEKKGMAVPEEVTVVISGPRRANVNCFLCKKSVALSTRDNKNGSWEDAGGQTSNCSDVKPSMSSSIESTERRLSIPAEMLPESSSEHGQHEHKDTLKPILEDA